MKGSRISAVITGAALSVGGLALAPIDGAAQAQSSTGICVKLVGVGHHYTVVAYPCARREPGFTILRRKLSHAVYPAVAI